MGCEAKLFSSLHSRSILADLLTVSTHQCYFGAPIFVPTARMFFFCPKQK